MIPAAAGTGVIGGPVRAVETVGIKDILTKCVAHETLTMLFAPRLMDFSS